MNHVIQQLRTWWLLEAAVRLTWGVARWLAVGLTVLGLACLADWIYDRYAETPFWARVLALLFQIGLAVTLAYVFVIRPMRRVPNYDDLATRAERAFPELGHRLVTALQLNRPGARTAGMSPALIAEVTREAGQMTADRQLTRLANYRPLAWAAIVLAPVLLIGGIIFAVNPSLVVTLVKRQLLLNVAIPRSVQLENVTKDVWPTGAEVTIRIRVTGEWDGDMVGQVRVRPDEQIEDHYDLKYEKKDSDGAAIFVAKLPPSSIPFTFNARLSDGRTHTPGRVEFEAPPQVKKLEAWQLLPSYLGMRPDGGHFERQNDGGLSGEVVDALPGSDILVVGHFTKPVVRAVLVPIERGGANADINRPAVPPIELSPDGLSAKWVFPTTQGLVGYRIELTDARGFDNPFPTRRGVRVWVDQPPEVERMRESTRDPDPNEYYGGGDPQVYEIDMPLSPGGRVMVIYHARSPLGIGEVNIAYRVIPRGQEIDNLHPRDDPNRRVFVRDVLPRYRLPLDPATAPDWKPRDMGRFIPDLGLFEKSFHGTKSWFEQERIYVPFYPLPSPDPANEPGELSAGGRYYLNTAGLIRPDETPVKLEVGDTLEIYVEVFDKYEVLRQANRQLPPRPAGYPREAIRKIVVDPSEAAMRTHQRKVTQSRLKDKLQSLVNEQEDLFNPPQPKKKP